MKKLSIAFITYNRADELIRAIESCFPIGIDGTDIYIWDNHSNCVNKTAIEKYISSKDLSIHYHYSEQNLGVAGGRNAVWQLCKSEYVFFLDDDAVIGQPNFFVNLCEYMDSHPNVGAAGINIEEPETKTQLNCKSRHTTKEGRIEILSFVGAAHVIRSSSVTTEFLYPEKLMFGSEELYACLVLWASRFSVHQIDDLLVLHMPSKINRNAGKERDTNFVINQYIVKKLVYPWYIMPIVLLVLKLRIKKNALSLVKCNQLVSERYDINERRSMSFGIWVGLVRKFGILPLI